MVSSTDRTVAFVIGLMETKNKHECGVSKKAKDSDEMKMNSLSCKTKGHVE